DFAALGRKAGEPATLAALEILNLVYPLSGNQTTASRFAEATAAMPADFTSVDLNNYKGLIAPFNDWNFVGHVCQDAGRQLLKRELAGKLPQFLPPNFE